MSCFNHRLLLLLSGIAHLNYPESKSHSSLYLPLNIVLKNFNGLIVRRNRQVFEPV